MIPRVANTFVNHKLRIYHRVPRHIWEHGFVKVGDTDLKRRFQGIFNNLQMDINGNIYISGLPKSTCRTADLFKLFCRVAQVKKVKLSSDKGTATVSLWDSSSVDFILSQKWTINGSTLILKHANCYQRKSEKMCSPYSIDDHAKKHLTEPRPSSFTYSHYKESQAPFWIDVPHSESKMVTSRRKKRKRTWFSSFCHAPMTIQTCENREKKTKLKRNGNKSKEKRNKKIKSSTTVPKHNLYSAISQETKKNSADFIQGHLTSMIPNTETLSSVKTEENLSLPNTETISSVNTEENPSVPNIKTTSIVKTEENFSAPNVETKSIVKTEENRSVSNIKTTSNASSIDVTKSPVSLGTCNKNLLIRKRSFMFPRTVDKTEHNKEKAITTTVTMETKRIPIYVHFATQRYIIYITNDSLRDIQKGILEKSRIPIDLQMIVYQGRIMGHTSNVALQPYDFVQVLIRGKGGMQNEEAGATTSEGKLDEEIQGATGGEEREEDKQIEEHETMKKENGAIALVSGISEKSSIEDVQKWLISIGITVEIIQKYDGLGYLDGDIIFNDYSPNDRTKFASDTGVPIGLARKILMLRNKSKDEFTSEMAMWNSNELNEYIEKFFTNISNKKMIFSLTAAITEKMIDGLVFINYENADDMALDFNDVESLKKIVFVRLLKDRDKKYGKCDKKDQKKIRKPDKTQNTPLKSETGTSSIDQYCQFIEKQLHLKHLGDVNEEVPCCNLKLIDTSWKKCDKFQQNFLFFVLCKESEYTTQKKESSLWKHVRNNTKLWVDICSENDKDLQSYQQKLADSSGSKDISLLESTSSWKYLMEKELDDIKRFHHCILLVSKQLNIEDNSYKIVLNANKKKPVFFHFSAEEKCNYILFNPEHYAFGFRIVPENTESLTRNTEIAKVSVLPPQIPRLFAVNANYYSYHQGHILPYPESSGTMLSRCIEYKLFTNSVTMKMYLEKFLMETLRFAAGCLNTRHNGTIYFGVGDSVGSQYKHGEIVGYPDEDNKVKVACTDNLRSAIKSCFSSESNSSADKCIADPYFLRVETEIDLSGSNLPLYVMEIDIQPYSDVCRDLCFEVNMAKCLKLKGVKGVKDKFILYARDSSSTREIDEKEKKGFINRDLIDYIKRRSFEEADKISAPDSPIEKPIDKLRRLLCKGRDKLDKSSYPIFVLGKPTEAQKDSNNSWMDTMSFIKRFPFISAVFDFDDKSNINGFSKTVRNKEYSTIESRKTFNQYLGDTQTLINKFNSNKTVWIFANGQADLTPPEHHLKSAEWKQNYIGVIDAVIFFSQHSVIPRSRALILIMLFSIDFDGVIETFLEIHDRFSRRGQILILAEENDIFKMFEESVTRRVGPGIVDLEGMSVVGVKWKNIKTTILDLVGYDDDCDFWLPGNGHLCPISERLRERLSDLELLNAKQCEGKKSNANARIQFKNEKEREFYKGNKVSWWNFYYESHVLKRNRFDNTRSKMENVLKYQKKQNYNILTFNLEHQPGAGGNTFVRHILWSFRKEYKCAVVKHLSENTPQQILDLWKSDFDVEDDKQSLLNITQEENAMPLLILLDDILQLEITYEEFIDNVKLVFRKETKSRNLKCLLCICSTVDEVLPLQLLPDSNSLTEILVQKLTDEEIIWMENKHTELKEEGNFDLKPENLLSFMALRTNFNRSKIESIVTSLMSKLDVQSFEFDLVQFIALITEKTLNFRRSTKIAVPLECCDDFYRFSDDEEEGASWERILPMSLNILLVFEDKETAGGKQIRMAHPMLAECVLEYALQIKKNTLSALTIDMLKSNLVKSTSRGRDDVFEIVHHMLNRRMVTDDEKQTKFSPLIESILGPEKSRKDKDYENAGEVLKEGLSLFINVLKFEKYAGTISQTLARLHSKWKHFDEAVEWAKKSLELAYKDNRCYFLHTYGNILKAQFQHLHKKLKKPPNNKVSAAAAVPLLKLILGALEQFVKAQNENIAFNTNSVLYSYKDSVISINLVCSFLKFNVIFPTDFDLKRFLIDDEYIPTNLPVNWDNVINSSLKKMKGQGEKALEDFEQQVFFYTTFYGIFPRIGKPNQEKIHRTHKELVKDYDIILAEFCAMFGEDGEEPPDLLCRPEMVSAIDEWHRRRILNLQGNTYINIFAMYGKFKDSKQGFTEQVTIARFQDIKTHYSRIEDKKPGDIAVSVCINIALGLVGGHRDSLNAIIDNCALLKAKSLMRPKEYSYMYDLACYFITVLMWPCKENKVRFNDELFNDSLRHLKDISKRRPAKVSKGRDMAFVREENGRQKATTQFFAANEKESKLPLICHRSDIYFKEHIHNDDFVWEKPLAKAKLKRLQGHVITKGENSSYQSITIKNEKMPDKFIEISQLRGKNSEILSEEPVTFYLGFSMSGPIAYNIKPVRNVGHE